MTLPAAESDEECLAVPSLVVVYELITGRSLVEILKLFKKACGQYIPVLPTPYLRILAKQLLHTLKHCHRVGVAHLDVKPDNIFVINSRRSVLLDFGQAYLLGKDVPSDACLDGRIGALAFLPPEVLLCSDLYTQSYKDLQELTYLLFPAGGARPQEDDSTIPEEGAGGSSPSQPDTVDPVDRDAPRSGGTASPHESNSKTQLAGRRGQELEDKGHKIRSTSSVSKLPVSAREARAISAKTHYQEEPPDEKLPIITFLHHVRTVAAYRYSAQNYYRTHMGIPPDRRMWLNGLKRIYYSYLRQKEEARRQKEREAEELISRRQAVRVGSPEMECDPDDAKSQVMAARGPESRFQQQQANPSAVASTGHTAREEERLPSAYTIGFTNNSLEIVAPYQTSPGLRSISNSLSDPQAKPRAGREDGEDQADSAPDALNAPLGRVLESASGSAPTSLSVLPTGSTGSLSGMRAPQMPANPFEDAGEAGNTGATGETRGTTDAADAGDLADVTDTTGPQKEQGKALDNRNRSDSRSAKPASRAKRAGSRKDSPKVVSIASPKLSSYFEEEDMSLLTTDMLSYLSAKFGIPDLEPPMLHTFNKKLACDAWAAGMVILMLLLGDHPFHKMGTYEMIPAIEIMADAIRTQLEETLCMLAKDDFRAYEKALSNVADTSQQTTCDPHSTFSDGGPSLRPEERYPAELEGLDGDPHATKGSTKASPAAGAKSLFEMFPVSANGPLPANLNIHLFLLIAGLLHPDPKLRLSITETLGCPFVQGLNTATLQSASQSLENLLISQSQTTLGSGLPSSSVPLSDLPAAEVACENFTESLKSFKKERNGSLVPGDPSRSARARSRTESGCFPLPRYQQEEGQARMRSASAAVGALLESSTVTSCDTFLDPECSGTPVWGEQGAFPPARGEQEDARRAEAYSAPHATLGGWNRLDQQSSSVPSGIRFAPMSVGGDVNNGIVGSLSHPGPVRASGEAPGNALGCEPWEEVYDDGEYDGCVPDEVYLMSQAPGAQRQDCDRFIITEPSSYSDSEESSF